MADGWIGSTEQVEHYLAVVGADKDADGKFKIYGGAPVSFMGAGDELCLNGEEEYSVDGHRCNLAAGLRSTSYGVGVKVIG